MPHPGPGSGAEESRALGLAFAPFLSWMYAIPLFGPVLWALTSARAVPLTPGIHILLIAVAVGLAAAPLQPTWLLPSRMMLQATGVIIGTSALFLLPVASWPFWYALAGLCSGAWIAGWMRHFAGLASDRRGRAIAVPTAAANIALYGFTWAAAKGLPLAYQSSALLALLLLSLLATAGLVQVTALPAAPMPAVASWVNWPRILSVYAGIAVLYLAGGVMFQGVYAELARDPITGLVLGALPYAGSVLLAGWWVDRRPLAYVTSTGIACLGSGLLAWMLLPMPWKAPLTQSLVYLGWGLVDVSLWVFLARLGKLSGRLALATGGLAAMIVGISGGAGLSEALLGGQASPAGLPLIGALVLFAAVPVLPLLHALPLLGAPARSPALPLPAHLVRAALSHLSLTARELEVVECLVVGHTLSQIAGRLFISRNTLKSHLRHIYHKCGVGDRHQLNDLVCRQAGAEGAHRNGTGEGQAP